MEDTPDGDGRDLQGRADTEPADHQARQEKLEDEFDSVQPQSIELSEECGEFVTGIHGCAPWLGIDTRQMCLPGT